MMMKLWGLTIWKSLIVPSMSTRLFMSNIAKEWWAKAGPATSRAATDRAAIDSLMVVSLRDSGVFRAASSDRRMEKVRQQDFFSGIFPLVEGPGGRPAALPGLCGAR